MARKLDKILVIDVEATCWEGKQPEVLTVKLLKLGFVY